MEYEGIFNVGIVYRLKLSTATELILFRMGANPNKGKLLLIHHCVPNHSTDCCDVLIFDSNSILFESQLTSHLCDV